MEMITNFMDEYNNHVTVTDNNNIEYEYSISKKRENVTAEIVLLEIRRFEYPDCPYPSLGLEEMEEWISKGCIIPAIMLGTEEDGVAEKVEWTNKHPVETDTFDRCKPSVETKAKLQALVDKIPEAQILMDLLVK